jgi:predicted metal-binding membrane protein
MAEIAIRRERDSLLAPAAVLAAILATSAAAWLVLAARMSGMDGGPGGDPGALGWFTVSWTVMTAAMLPAAAPTVLRAVRVAPSKTGATLPFLAGYGAVWMVAGLAGYAVVVAVRSAHPGALAASAGGRYLAGAVVAAAGLYQLSGAKRRWLARCAAPRPKLGRAGTTGALLAGLEHGGCCVACCWNLMVVLYALGMMSIPWMVLLSVLIVAQRLLPRRRFAVFGAAALLIVLGTVVAAAPAEVPELTTPGAGMKMGGGMQMGRRTEMKPKSKSTMDAAPGSSVGGWPRAASPSGSGR